MIFFSLCTATCSLMSLQFYCHHFVAVFVKYGWQSSSNREVIMWQSSISLQTVIRHSYMSLHEIIRQLSGSLQAAARQPSGRCQAAFRQTSGSDQAVVRQSFCLLLKIQTNQKRCISPKEQRHAIIEACNE